VKPLQTPHARSDTRFHVEHNGARLLRGSFPRPFKGLRDPNICSRIERRFDLAPSVTVDNSEKVFRFNAITPMTEFT